MIALSIKQPWAWAILHAGKDIENRSWKTNYRGPVLIHAGKGFDSYGFSWLQHFNPTGIEIPGIKSFDLGGIVGQIEIVDCVEESESPWFFGRYGFVLANPELLAFRPILGKLGFFDVRFP